MRVPNVGRAMMNLAGVRLRRLQRHGRTVVHAVQRAGRKATRYGEAIPQVPALLRARVHRGQAAIERAGKRARRFDDHVLTPYRTERRVKRILARAASERCPIIVGPWTSEVGYEVLYWLPFLRWAVNQHAIAPERLVAVSRGGAALWYERIAGRYVEIFDLIDPATFAEHAAARHAGGDQKQMTPSEFDRHLTELVRQRLDVDRVVLWHPGLMYQLFRSFWYGDRSRQFLFRHMDFRYPRIVGAPGEVSLPKEYVAVKFYTGPALPGTDSNAALLCDLVERLAARTPVVMLDTTWTTDEHRDYAFDEIHGVTTLRPSLDPKTNLDLQTRVIAGARQFIGTCGGLAWLAPFLGVDTLAVYEDDRYLAAHLYAARYAYRKSGAARFSTLNIRALRSVNAAVASAF